jgi:hypothetical protein
MPEPDFMELGVYHGICAHLSGVLHKSLPPVSMCNSVPLLRSGSVKTSPQQRIRVVFYAVCVATKEIPELLVIILTLNKHWIHYMKLHTYIRSLIEPSLTRIHVSDTDISLVVSLEGFGGKPPVAKELSTLSPRGGGFEYLHRIPASRRRPRNGNPVPAGVIGPPSSWGI